jgi:hypothetical protein
MCYERRFFSQWGMKKQRTGEEPKSVIERLQPSAQLDRRKPETKKPKEVEPELETLSD